MAEIASAFVTIAPSAKGFGSKLQSEVGGDIDKTGKGIGSKFGAAVKLGAGAALGGAVLAAGFLKGAIGEARDAQKVGALTNAVIKSTGGIANVTAKDVDRLATSISLKTGVDDEAIAAGQNMLLTFGNVRNEVGKGNDIFSQATVAATDMAAAFGGDAVSNSKMLGKALNDPTKGVSALTRVGVSFTQQQKDQIATLQESGDMLGAQKIILGELSKQTAGAAESQATAGQKFGTAFGNLQESVGTLLLPMIDKVLGGLTTFVVLLTNDIGPGIAALNGYLAPGAAALKAFFGSLFAGGGAASGLAATFQSRLLPVLQTAANTFRNVILPAVTAVVTYVVGKLVPVFVQIAGIVTNRVLPILSSLAQFFYGKVIPALVAVAQSVAAKLKPVFDQLVTTFRSKVLPAVNRLLAKFQEWQPTIQKVILVVVKIIGKVLEFAAGILGRVLPVVIRFAGFLISGVVPAISAGVSILGKIIAAFVDTGRQISSAVQAFGRFADAVDAKIRAALGFVAAIPSKVQAVFSGASTLLYNAGVQLMTGLALGIRNKIQDAINEVQAGLSKIKGLLPGSPIKWGPLKNWNNGGAGKRLMDLVAKGIAKGTPKTVEAAEAAFGKIGDSLKSTRDNLKGTLEGLKSDFKSLADSVAQSFTGDLFGITATEAVAATADSAAIAGRTAGQNFIDNLMGKKAQLTGLLASFKTLQGWGIDPGFLSQLFASGNGGLITELAGMGQTGAMDTAALFGEVNALGAQLGNAVAANDPISDRIDETNKLLTTVTKQLDYLGSDIGKELNQAAAKAHRDKKGKGKP